LFTCAAPHSGFQQMALPDNFCLASPFRGVVRVNKGDRGQARIECFVGSLKV